MQLALQKEIVCGRSLGRLLGAAAAVICIALGAFVRIPVPFSPVPITLQTFFVLLSGACLGASLGTRAVAAYILLGFAGLPVFSGANSGWIYLAGPTGGYLAGFILAQSIVWRMTSSFKQSYARTLGVFLVADIVVLCCGTLWLAAGCGFSWDKALLIGLVPFIPGDIAKAAAAAALYSRISGRCRTIFS
jgi:biotin transport system substrate-specific component